MNNIPGKINLKYGLLLLPLISAVLALAFSKFIFKAGVAGTGILILIVLYHRHLRINKDVWAIAGAFLFSIAGDWFLSNRHGDLSMFIAGIALFFVAHAGYLTFALMNGRINRMFTLLILGVYLVFFFLVLFPGIQDKTLMSAALVYLLISCFSVGAATGIAENNRFKWLYVFGIVMVLFSDTVISLREFVKFKELDFLILPTYYLAQISIVASLIFRKNYGTLSETSI
jgi:uncharacterized membrane protein YhhN